MAGNIRALHFWASDNWVRAAVATGIASIVAVLVILPRCIGRFSGDAMIHLTFAERLAHRNVLEFNAGESSAGTTSLLWNLIEASLLSVLSLPAALWAILAICLSTWVASGFVAYRIARDLGAGQGAATLTFCVVVGMPGTIANAPGGMEGPLFALLVALVLRNVERTAYARLQSFTSAVAYGALSGVMAWLRPEGLVIAALALIWLVASRQWRTLGFSVLFVTIIGVAVLSFHYYSTGHWLPGSGVARVAAARRDSLSVHFGPFWLYGRPVSRLIGYGMFCVPAVLMLAPRVAVFSQASRRARVMAASAVAGIVLYSFVTGAAHTGRYFLWIWPILVPVAVAAVERRSRVVGPVLIAINFVGVGAVECAARVRDPSQTGGVAIADLVHSFDRRSELTDLVITAIGHHQGPVPRLGFVEVQARWSVDDRVAIESMDGRTSDSRHPMAFDPDGCPKVWEEPPMNIVLFDSIRGMAPRCRFPAWVDAFELARSGKTAGSNCWREVKTTEWSVGLIWSGSCHSAMYFDD